jgi:hypothetical protein
MGVIMIAINKNHVRAYVAVSSEIVEIHRIGRIKTYVVSQHRRPFSEVIKNHSRAVRIYGVDNSPLFA